MKRCAVEFEDGTSCGILAGTKNEQGKPVCIDHAPKCRVCQRPLLTPLPDGLHQECFVAEGFKVMAEMLRQEPHKNIGLKASESAKNGANNHQ